MGGTLSFSCLQGATFESLKCWCCASKKPAQGVVYVSRGLQQSFILLDTPFLPVKDFIVTEDLPKNTLTWFYKDSSGRIRSVMHHESHEVGHRLSVDAVPPEDGCDANIGSLLEDILPGVLKVPLLKFMSDTLDGTHYQLHGLFSATPMMIRTTPVIDHEGKVVCGLLQIGEYHPVYDEHLNRFVLNRQPVENAPPRVEVPPEEQKKRKSIDQEIEEFPATAHMGRKIKDKQTRTL